MSSYELLGRLRKSVTTKDMPALIITAYEEEIEIDKLKNHVGKGTIPLLTKPIDLNRFEKFVTYLL